MSFDLTNDNDQPESPNLPGVSEVVLLRVRNGCIIAVGLLFAFLILWWLRTVYTDLLWYDKLGYQSVFTKILVMKIWLFIGGTAVTAAALIVNFYFTFRFSRGPSTLPVTDETMRLLRALLVAAVVITVLTAAPVFGSAAAGRWETFLLFLNKVSFGVSDAEFGNDLSFFIVTLRMLNFVQSWVMGILVVSVVMSLLLYAGIFGLRGLNFFLSPRMLKHIGILGGLLMLSIAAGHVLSTYELVVSQDGLVAGADYTDINARIPVLWLMTSIAALGAAAFFVSNYFGGLRLMAGSFSLWVIMVLLANLAFPALFQRFQVDPNEFEREQIYIERNIESTRTAYQLDLVEGVALPAVGDIDADVIASNLPVIDNIRLWDVEPLQDAYNQLQFMELYYNFLNMDSDRYVLDGRLRQVLLAARELDPDNLPADARNWVNRRLQYTHGFGVAMSPATGFTPDEGRPEFFIQDIPIRGEIPIERPELYYGESPAPFAIVNSTAPEIDPSGSDLHYDGAGGVNLGSTFRRLAYAWQFADINILLSDQISSDTRIQYRRQISERVKALAPFLTMDDDPYPVVDGAGKVWWLQDAFTTTGRYPYSTITEEGFNYIRNSVKAVVDAFNGQVSIYVMDLNDPLLQMYRRAFPSLFSDFDQMPVELQAHIRYPNGIFSAQADMYLRYHVTDAQVFFNQAEQWAVPQDTRFGRSGVEIHPSYLILQMPGGDSEEFVLMLPFSPAGDKKNLVGWLTARNDGEHYGKLNAFTVPSDPQVDGPAQVEARIENDQSISQQFTLWDGAGSQVVRGQLLVIPVGDAIIYVEPLYLQSEVLAFPELKKVILADGSNVVMADSVGEGLAMLLADKAALESEPVGEGVQATSDTEDLGGIEDAVTDLDEALKELQEAVERLRESLESGSQ
ncbi:MAG: UPF0182 family protein [SAR202 cluster bacterium]|jgi:hypothetical protein|nr:UPF0182 family protein [Dehalococcoidia bacterium]MQG10321.1 UPF0182 family protein [SAR202 cluster bacterium]MQG54361.1 UPF0182 family protein [SAR202 cluster bacterium]|tara:strand:+ start:81533 stop:84253 length:2721 start_codon:yes stop_codon:yes gene_type:complete